MVRSKKFWQDPGKELNLASTPNELVVDHTCRIEPILDAVEEEWMLADFAELHELVGKTFDTTRFAVFEY